ncbi:NADH-quinone oxidoreductase subunit I [bacterium]|nr:NADH-quinone oxidoreductase subunit I [bacterium]
MKRFFKEPWDVVISLVKGLAITLRQLFSKPCTIQYPEERLIWPDRTRGRLVLPRDPETGKNRCTACMICQRSCPNGSIEITGRTNAAGKKEAEDYLLHLDRCTFCGICVEVCPFDALRMSHEHELAVTDKTALTLHLQNESIEFNEKWRGGLPGKQD